MTQIDTLHYCIVTKHETAHHSKLLWNRMCALPGNRHIWTIDTPQEFKVNPHRQKLEAHGVTCDYNTHNIILVEMV